MLWLICIIGGMIVVPILCEIFEGYWDALSIVLGALVGIAASLILVLCFTIILQDAPTTVYENNVCELIALNDGISDETSGVFFLGTGHVSSDEDLEYRFMYRTEKGMTVGERNANRVYLEYISTDETPRLVSYKERYNNKFWNWLLGAVSSWETFYIPQGSITNNIAIDLH